MLNSSARQSARVQTLPSPVQSAGASSAPVEAVISLFDHLVRAELSGAAYRVVLDTLARLLRHGIDTEAVPVDWMADRLNVSRNTIGAAYQAAEEAGLVRRTTIAARGAPTRTSLAGMALRLAQVARDPGRVSAVGGSRFARRNGSSDERHHGTRQRPRDTGDPGRVTPHLAGPWAEGGQGVNGFAALEHVADAPAAEYVPTGEMPDVESEADRPRDPARVIDEVAEPLSNLIGAVGRSFHSAPILHDEGLNEHAKAQEHQTEPSDPARVTLSPVELMEAIGRLPAEARLAASQTRGGSPLIVDPAWALSDDDVALLRRLVPPKERPRPNSTVAPKAPRTGVVANNVVASTLWQSMYQLEAIVGKGRALVVADEIAFQVMQKQLGKGDLAGGVRAGLSLVSNHRWKTPRGFTADWQGAVERAIRSTTTSACDAQKTVH